MSPRTSITQRMRYLMNEDCQKPSNGSLICTFADCPDRKQDMRKFSEVARGGDYDKYCPLSMRCGDFSACKHPDVKIYDDIEWNTYFCEVAVREGVCPRGFTR
jgi:hypothetical protein